MGTEDTPASGSPVSPASAPRRRAALVARPRRRERGSTPLAGRQGSPVCASNPCKSRQMRLQSVAGRRSPPRLARRAHGCCAMIACPLPRDPPRSCRPLRACRPYFSPAAGQPVPVPSWAPHARPQPAVRSPQAWPLGLRALPAGACEAAQRLQVLRATYDGAARWLPAFLEVCLKEQRSVGVLEHPDWHLALCSGARAQTLVRALAGLQSRRTRAKVDR